MKINRNTKYVHNLTIDTLRPDKLYVFTLTDGDRIVSGVEGRCGEDGEYDKFVWMKYPVRMKSTTHKNIKHVYGNVVYLNAHDIDTIDNVSADDIQEWIECARQTPTHKTRALRYFSDNIEPSID